MKIGDLGKRTIELLETTTTTTTTLPGTNLNEMKKMLRCRAKIIIVSSTDIAVQQREKNKNDDEHLEDRAIGRLSPTHS